MVLTCIILSSLILVFILLCWIGWACDYTIRKWFNHIFMNRDEDYVIFNCGMFLVLFLVMFITSAAIYNTCKNYRTISPVIMGK